MCKHLKSIKAEKTTHLQVKNNWQHNSQSCDPPHTFPLPGISDSPKTTLVSAHFVLS